MRLDHVRSGRQSSCGCIKNERIGALRLSHGHSRGYQRTPELRAWQHAKGRCNCPTDQKYQNYGGRGIRMCREWEADFAVFFRDMGQRPEGTTLDRIDVNGNYEPGNCRWATPAEQARNRTDNVFVELDGERLILKDYAAATGQDYKRLSAQRKR